MKRRAWRQAREAIVCVRPAVCPLTPPATLHEELAIGFHIRQLGKLKKWFAAQGLPLPD